MVKVHLHYGAKRMETYAILDDGSERTMLLHQAAQQLGLRGQKEELALRTIRQDIRTMPGRSVSFSVSSVTHPQRRYKVQRAFTSPELGLSPHSHPVEELRKAYRHLRGLPLHSFKQVQPLLLIGSDYPDLLVPIEPVHVGPRGSPIALRTQLGWTLQGPAKVLRHRSSTVTCMYTSTPAPSAEVLQKGSKPSQTDVMPCSNEKPLNRSKQDAAAANLLAVRSQVAPVTPQQQPIPRLELCAAHTGSQLGSVLEQEAPWPIHPEPPPQTTDDSAELLKSQELQEATVRACHGVARQTEFSAEDFKNSEMVVFREVQRDSWWGDSDSITPNMLLMGRRDPPMPQVVYTDILSWRRWRHCQARVPCGLWARSLLSSPEQMAGCGLYRCRSRTGPTPSQSHAW
ncbi:uncharacterized protein ACNS7B_005229 [Menidia menidia]